MKLKKLTSILLTTTLVISLFAMPAVASSKFNKPIIDNQFNTAGDTEGWVKGAVKSGTASFTVTQGEAPDGSGALILHSEGGSSGEAGKQPNAYKALDEKIAFNPNNKIIIKTRFMQAGNGADTPSGAGYLKFNQPNDIAFSSFDDIKWNWTNTWKRTDAVPANNGANKLCRWFQLLGFDTTKLSYMAANDQKNWRESTYSAVNTVGKWIEATITINGSENIKVTASIGGEQGGTVNGTLNQGFMLPRIAYTLYNDKTATEWIETITSLDSLTWETTSKNDIYIDYVQVYEEKDFITASVSLPNGTYIRASDSIDIQLTSESAIETLPADAFEITGVETDFAYNATTKTVTLTPKAPLNAGGIYYVEIDANKIADAEGITLEGETSYTIEVSDVNVNDLTATGRVIPGNVITSAYVYSSSKPEGTHSYQWQMSASGEDGTFEDILGATSKDFTVTENEYGKYLRFKMIPYALDENGGNTLYGFESYSNAVIPEKKPVASNVEISTSTLFSGIYISASYDYSDENGDTEGDSTISWYTAGSAEEGAEWSLRGTGRTYFIENEDADKYIKCVVTPVAASQYEAGGLPAESQAYGPVVNIIETTNMFADAGFEKGVLESPWMNNSETWVGGSLQQKDVYAGEYALRLPPRTALNDNFGQKLNYKGGKTYVIGAKGKKARADKAGGVTVFAGGTAHLTPIGGKELTYTLDENWQQIAYAYKCTQNVSALTGFVSWTQMATADMYLDDYYCGELVVSDIETYEVEPVTVPESGETKIALTSGVVLNQLGSKHGLEEETVVVSIPETEGVYVDGNYIVVTEQAKPSTFTAEIYCEPQYEGATQSLFQKFVEIEVLPHNNPTPKALNVTASGIVAEGNTLTGSYDFYQINGKNDASEYRWMYSETENGVYYDILGATGETYTVEAEYAEKYIKFAVIPKTDDGIVGKEAISNPLTGPKAPVASEVKISGEMSIGSTIEGKYKFFDANYDDEGVSAYRWLICDTENGAYTAIAGETAKTLTLTESMKDKYIKFEVTPKSVSAPEVGRVAESKPILGPSAPYVTDVSVVRDDNRLVGVYKYNHPHFIQEGKSLYNWTIDGQTVSTEADYVISFTGTKTITFSVTPVSTKEPSKGNTVSVSMTVTGHSAPTGGNVPVGGVVSGGGGTGGGVSGGSGSGAGVTSVNDMKLPENKIEQKPEEQKPVSDIDSHWGAEYIQNMADRGVMEADENGNYQPDELVTRESMLTYLFKALGLEATEYTGIFGDVEDGEFAKMLQTMVDNGTIAADDNFRPGDSISREEMCKILYVSLENAGKLEKTDEMLIEEFADYGSISEWARVYVNGVYANGIMVGVSDTEFDAQGEVTKAQAATMLVRILALTEEAE